MKNFKGDIKTLLQFLKSKKITAGTIAEKLVITEGYISDMKNGRKPVTAEFIKGLEDNYPKELNEYYLLSVAKGKKGELFPVKQPDSKDDGYTDAEENNLNEPTPVYGQLKQTKKESVSQHLNEQMLADLIISNKSQAESHKKLSEANLILARNNENLIAKMGSTAGGEREIPLVLEQRFSEILELIAELGTGKRWNSKAEALEELNKLVIAHR